MNLLKFKKFSGKNIKYAAYTAILALSFLTIGIQALKMTTKNIGRLHYEPVFQKFIEKSYKNPALKHRWINFQAKNKCCGTFNIEQVWLRIKNNSNNFKMLNHMLNTTENNLLQQELSKTNVSSHIMQYFILKLTDLHYYPCPVEFGYQTSCTDFIEHNIVKYSRIIVLFGYLLLSNLVVLLVLQIFSCYVLKNNIFIQKLKDEARQQQQIVT